MIVAFACIRIPIMCKCSKIRFTPDSAQKCQITTISEYYYLTFSIHGNFATFGFCCDSVTAAKLI